MSLLVDCKCGCGKRLEKYDSRNRERKYLPGHYFKGRKKPDFWKRFMSKIMTGPLNHQWNPDRSQVGRMGQYFTKKQRTRLLKARCEACRASQQLELDHVIPVMAGGTSADSNAQTLCRKCNQDKRTRDISFYGKPGELRKTPATNWLGNSEPNSDGNILVGATTRGRVYGRKGTRMRAVEASCDLCRKVFLRSLWKYRTYKNRPTPKHVFCGDVCRLSFLNSSKTVISSTSAGAERQDIV